MTSDDLAFEEMIHELRKFATKNGLDFMYDTNVEAMLLVLRFHNPQTRQCYMQGVRYGDLIRGHIQKLYEMIIERVKKELLDETAEKVNQSS